MKRVFVLLGLVGAAAYLFGPPLPAPQDHVELALSPPSVSGPLRTSWGFTLKSLRQAPAVSQHTPQHTASPRSASVAAEPDRLLVLGEPDGDTVAWAKATLAAYRERSKASKPDAVSPEAPPEIWVIGQTNGWVHQEDSATEADGLPSYKYVAAIDNVRFAQSTAKAVKSHPAQTVSPKPQLVAAVAAAAEEQDATPTAKPVAHTQDAIKVAGPYSPRGLFARRAHSDDAPRGGGLFGLFGARKTERSGWSVGPAG